jgi:hypothetical protein
MKTFILIGAALIILFILFKILKAFIKIGVILIVILLGAAYFTNPDDATHRQRFKETAKELRLKKVKDKNVQVDDYFLFSLTKINADGEQKVVGVGAFGKVWYFGDLPGKKKNNKR